jgi:hypothetical protein
MITAITDVGKRDFNSAVEAMEWQAIHSSTKFILDDVDISHLDIVQRENKHLCPTALTTFQAVNEFVRLKNEMALKIEQERHIQILNLISLFEEAMNIESYQAIEDFIIKYEAIKNNIISALKDAERNLSMIPEVRIFERAKYQFRVDKIKNLIPKINTACTNSSPWQPIETAPKDQTVVFIYVPGEKPNYPKLGLYYTKKEYQKELEKEHGPQNFLPDGWYWSPGITTGYKQCSINPTHWMPIPKDPSSP